MPPENENQVFSSFRDSSGYLFYRDNELFRQINQSYKEDYQLLMDSGLYQSLCDKNWLVSHEETSEKANSSDSHLIIKPRRIPFISYPYEWSFSQLKDAAILTLEIQQEALSKGMTLKDASAYNIQFADGSPVFIDTLSFETYQDGSPWVAYRQFCQHFLAPLALMAHVDIRMGKMLVNYIDGIPLDLACKLLPGKTRFSFSLGLHLHLHARQQIKNSDAELNMKEVKLSMPMRSQLALLDGLLSGVKKLSWSAKDTEWHDYYANNNNYENESLSEKEKLVSAYVQSTTPHTVWDLGANDGRFSRIASQYCESVISWDIDPACVENNYLTTKERREKKILPLLMDLTNPSPDIGWSNNERDGFMRRGPCDALLALGLVHHLAIANNLPLTYIASSFSQLTKHLIIEFVPKEDSQVVKLLKNRVDVFDDYTQDKFEEIFLKYYSLEKSQLIEGTVRTLYLFKSLTLQ